MCGTYNFYLTNEMPSLKGEVFRGSLLRHAQAGDVTKAKTHKPSQDFSGRQTALHNEPTSKKKNKEREATHSTEGLRAQALLYVYSLRRVQVPFTQHMQRLPWGMWG